MAYFDLTSNAQIRALFTTTDSNLDDDMLDNYGLDDELGLALDSLPGWDEPTISDKVKRLLRLFAKYFCAAQVAKTAAVFILKKETDGSNEGQRSDKDGYDFLFDRFSGEAGKYLALLQAELSIDPGPVAVPLALTRVVPTRDPITEPRETNES